MFNELPSLLRAGDVLVVNDTRVLKARLEAVKASGGRAEILLERALDERRFLAQVRASRAPRPGSELRVAGELPVTVRGRHNDLFELELAPGETLERVLDAYGALPLPPYIRRAADAVDAARYQTVYAATPGAVAAPTAGLHFDRALLAEIDAAGVERATLTLHVGAGTFSPLRSDDVSAHRMHAERVTVSEALCESVARAHQRGARVVAVGTTCVRALESAAASGSLEPLCADTRLFITPGYRFRVVDALVSNFHLPRSTLLMLVCAFAGRDRVLSAYAHAVASQYRFFSYGDASWLEPMVPRQ